MELRQDHESRLRECEKALADGRTTFAEFRKDITQLRESVDALIYVMRWVAFGVCGVVGLSVLKMIPGLVP
jgi:ElaB/YqjD/DUF883 family membrane-anchored ribosome-binding protein